MLSFSDFLLLIPSLGAIVLIVFGYPLAYYVIARIFIKVWPVRALRFWAMSGIDLKNMPKHCHFSCDGSCRNWTCPNYSSLNKK